MLRARQLPGLGKYLLGLIETALRERLRVRHEVGGIPGAVCRAAHAVGHAERHRPRHMPLAKKVRIFARNLAWVWAVGAAHLKRVRGAPAKEDCRSSFAESTPHGALHGHRDPG